MNWESLRKTLKAMDYVQVHGMPASGNPGIYVSLLQPNLIDPVILQSYKTRVNTLDRHRGVFALLSGCI